MNDGSCKAGRRAGSPLPAAAADAAAAPRLLFADDALLIAEKPVGLPSQTDAGGGDSLPARLAAAGLPVFPVHRLDCGTGGVIVYARTKRAAAALSAMVGQHETFVKDYLAVVCGRPEPPFGTLTDWLYHDVRRNKSYVVSRERRGVRSASLDYRVLRTVSTPAGERTLLTVRLHTGRTHQIRVQFASRGWPLAGDRRYGGDGGSNPALWSCRLSFPHPFGGEPLCAESLPDLSGEPWSLFADVLGCSRSGESRDAAAFLKPPADGK